jgi:hypothetical protein
LSAFRGGEALYPDPSTFGSSTAGARKWRLNPLDGSDLVAYRKRTSRVTGIPLPEEVYNGILESILS